MLYNKKKIGRNPCVNQYLVNPVVGQEDLIVPYFTSSRSEKYWSVSKRDIITPIKDKKFLP